MFRIAWLAVKDCWRWFQKMLFYSWDSYDAYFHLYGSFNKQSIRCWSAGYTRKLHERPLQELRATSIDSVTGLHFFKEVMRYFSELNLSDQEKSLLQQDDAEAHTAKQMLKVNRDRLISLCGCELCWSALSPDLSLCGFFF